MRYRRGQHYFLPATKISLGTSLFIILTIIHHISKRIFSAYRKSRWEAVFFNIQTVDGNSFKLSVLLNHVFPLLMLK